MFEVFHDIVGDQLKRLIVTGSDNQLDAQARGPVAVLTAHRDDVFPGLDKRPNVHLLGPRVIGALGDTLAIDEDRHRVVSVAPHPCPADASCRRLGDVETDCGNNDLLCRAVASVPQIQLAKGQASDQAGQPG